MSAMRKSFRISAVTIGSFAALLTGLFLASATPPPDHLLCQRGSGPSQRVSADDPTLANHVEELNGVIDTLAPDQEVTLVGHSWGAILASAFMAQHLDRVSKVVLMEAGYLNAAKFRDWQERAQNFMSGPSCILASIWQGFRASHLCGPDDHAAKDVIFAHMDAKFANHPENPYHCPDQGYNAPLSRFGSEASDAVANISEADLEALLPAANIDATLAAIKAFLDRER
ncbi:MAG: alpha/beta fold hydrolase [Paracoccaceae bacterium]